jgi:hypothetical protein
VTKPRDTDNSLLREQLAKWFGDEIKTFYRRKTLSPQETAETHARAEETLRYGLKHDSLRVLWKLGKPAAVVTLQPARYARVPGQKALSFFTDRSRRSSYSPWIKKQLSELGKKAPLNTVIGFSPEIDETFGRTISKSGFDVRYEILRGDTKKALSNLKREKNPPRSLEHLGLELKPIASPKQLPEVTRLQRYVALRSKSHGYFSHFPSQLKRDQEEYRMQMRTKTGLILGVFKNDRLLGLMITGIHGNPGDKHGGFSFFLHPSIQGLGITKTGYLHLLEFLEEKNVLTFQGGTSQPAIKKLGRVMKREVLHVMYVKMGLTS